MTATKKLTAYGAVVVAALVMGFALLTAAFAAPSVGDGSETVTADDAKRTLKAIDDNHGKLDPNKANQGTFEIVTQPASGGSVSVGVGDIKPVTATVTAAVDSSKEATTIKVKSTANFPSSGYFFIDTAALAAVAEDDEEQLDNVVESEIVDSPTGINFVGLDFDDEIVKCTGITSKSLTGCERGIGATSVGAHLSGSVVHPIKYSTITVVPYDSSVAGGSFNVADPSVFVKAGRLVAIAPVAADATAFVLTEAFAYNGRSGSTLLSADLTGNNVLPVGSDVFQFGRTVDTAMTDIDVDSGFTGSFTYEYEYTVGTGDAKKATVTVTVISDNPVANDVSGTVTATLPAPLPIILVFSGTDSSSPRIDAASDPSGAVPELKLTSLPTAGLLDMPISDLICTNVSGAVLGEVMTNCTAQTVYTPLAGATGTDTFTYTITNGGDTSAAATVTITLPGGMVPTPVVPAPTMGEGFAGALAPGVTLTTYGGGTVAQLNADASTAGATSVAVTDSGTFVVLVVDGPSFVNRAFNDLFSDGVPAGTVVLVLVSS